MDSLATEIEGNVHQKVRSQIILDYSMLRGGCVYTDGCIYALDSKELLVNIKSIVIIILTLAQSKVQNERKQYQSYNIT